VVVSVVLRCADAVTSWHFKLMPDVYGLLLHSPLAPQNSKQEQQNVRTSLRNRS
jgi:hypothetical protein